MRLLDWYVKEDFGKELVITLLKTKKYSLIQLSFGWSDYSSGWPYLQISMGNHRLLDILFYWMKFSFCVEIFGTTWNRYYIND
jgi:hypothetical protein